MGRQEEETGETEYRLDGVRQLKERQEKAGMFIKTSISYWDIQQRIPLQILEMELPIDEIVYCLGFTEMRKTFVLTKLEGKDEGESDEKKKPVEPKFFVKIFDEGDNFNCLKVASLTEIVSAPPSTIMMTSQNRHPGFLQNRNTTSTRTDPYEVKVVWEDKFIFTSWESRLTMDRAGKKKDDDADDDKNYHLAVQ